jgi:hypothetical protein
MSRDKRSLARAVVGGSLGFERAEQIHEAFLAEARQREQRSEGRLRQSRWRF